MEIFDDDPHSRDADECSQLFEQAADHVLVISAELNRRLA